LTVDPSAAFWYTAGVVVLLVVLQVLARPLELLARVLGRSLLGGLAIWVVNLAGAAAGFHLPLNPASAAVVGLLGVPGFLALVVLRSFLG
jgi:inhibitor of the pro-sigma K processing machinery